MSTLRGPIDRNLRYIRETSGSSSLPNGDRFCAAAPKQRRNSSTLRQHKHTKVSPKVAVLCVAILLASLGIFESSKSGTRSFFAEARPDAGRLRTFLPPVTTEAKHRSKHKLLLNRKKQDAGGFRMFWPEPPPAPRRRLNDIIKIHIRKLVSDAKESMRVNWEWFKADLTLAKTLEVAAKVARFWTFWFFSKDSMSSIYEDRWHAEREPDKYFGSDGMWVSKGAHKDVVKRRIHRSQRNRMWVGLGYTPRLVWLVGVLLRGTFQCTSVPKVFNPSLTGWGAGTILGAKCTHQEWIATFMIGWFGSEYYWKYLFGCKGPPFAEPGFDGIPVFITKIRNVRL